MPFVTTTSYEFIRIEPSPVRPTVPNRHRYSAQAVGIGHMSTIRVVWGTGRGPTEMAAYDAALADANVHEYNLAHVSSIVPPEATVEPVGTAPDLGPVGGRLWVVEARTTAEGPATLSAALGWATDGTGGVFYEDAGLVDEAAVRETVTNGLTTARELRDAALSEETVRSVSFDVDAGTYGTALVLAAYGEVEPMFSRTGSE